MKKARILRRELDYWKLAWQQIDAFLERIDGMRDQDEPFDKRCRALLGTAGVIEHQQALFFGQEPLSDPIADRLPGSWFDPANGASQSISAEEVWGDEYRLGRLPGSDELEIAVANLIINDEGELDGDETVHLRRGMDLKLEQRVGKDDPRYQESAQGLVPVEMPSYPGRERGLPIVSDAVGQPTRGDATLLNQAVALKGDGSDAVRSLFSKSQREDATLNRLDEEEEATTAWSACCTERRNYSGETRYVGPSGDPPWSGAEADRARLAIEHVRAGTAPAVDQESFSQLLSPVIQAAYPAARWLEQDSTTLQAAADTLDEVGTENLALPTAVRGASDEMAGQKSGFETVAAMASALLGVLGPGGASQSATQQAGALAEQLAVALDGLGSLEPQSELLRSKPEDSAMLAEELDAVFAARLAYPDGSLRLLRTLEWTFLDVWPARRRWFYYRYRRVLAPLLRGFRRPFIEGLKALIEGGDTGLPCVGLELATSVSVGAETLPTTHPASLRQAVSDIETGHVAIIGGDRPAAAVILGLGQENGKLLVNTAPLRVSVGTQPPGSAGLVLAGATLECEADPLSRDELRLSESNLGAAADGPVHEAVALWSRLSLVFGWRRIEEELQDGASIAADDYHRRLIPEPSSQPLHEVRFYGRMEPNTLSIAIRGLGEAFWERNPGEPALPLVARPGELLLLRGRAEASEEGETGPLVQVVVEVESAYRTTGAMLERMESDQLAQLATSPLSADEEQACRLLCRPQEEIVMLILRQTWLTEHTLIDDIHLGRDFAGFDGPSLATETLLPKSLVGTITGTSLSDDGYDRYGEYAAAQQQLAAWTRYAR